ncbi:MAG: NfeD family protein [Clostridia bacterium]|nr:NfeD family protein [Clostridia bacterium]
MIAWWNQLQTIQQVFALIAIPATLVMLIQTVMLLVGFGGESDTDVDGDDVFEAGAESDGFILFSVRGIVSMLTVMGWSAVALLETLAPWLAISIAAVLGLATLFGMAYLMRAVSMLQASGNIDVENAVGKVATVYIPVPPKGKGSGKVTITLQETYTELSAITTAAEKLATGTYVRVVAVDGTGTLVVEPLVEEGAEGQNEK